MKIIDKVKGTLGLTPTPERQALLEDEVKAAQAALNGAVHARELGYLSFERGDGGEDLRVAAETAVEVAELRLNRAKRTLDAFQTVGARRATEKAQADHKARWDDCQAKADLRIADAAKLVEHLQAAGELFVTLRASGMDLHRALPHSWLGGFDAMKLGPAQLQKVVSFELERNHLVQPRHGSLLASAPTLTHWVEDAAALVRDVRTEDERQAGAGQ